MIPPILKHSLDALASAVGVAYAFASSINIVTALTVIWWVLRIYQMPVVQRWFGKGDGK